MALVLPAPGLSALAALRKDGILSSIISLIYKPLMSIDLSEFMHSIRVVINPVLDINVMQILSLIYVEVLADIIHTHGAMLRMSIFHTNCNKATWVENVTLTCLNTIDWNRFCEVAFEYPRLQVLLIPKLFPIVPGGTCGSYFLSKAITPSRYPTLLVLELFWATFFLTINFIPTADYQAALHDLRPSALNHRPCINEIHGCTCSHIKLCPTRIQSGISGFVQNYLSPIPYLRNLDVYTVLALPAWESGCVAHVIYGFPCGPIEL
ncbi:hypothetical protein VTL71DRAFT_4759 [Oculimacula yallundae]|uniref:Uncharacterized protein n=1 Tax=Oculimacula yallundae TaxID=86028 RepID=A0ABR4C2Y4_9HELO